MPPEANSNKPDNNKRQRAMPEFWQVAHGLYKDSFGVRDKEAFAEAAGDFSELGAEEQRFYVAHLGYLQVEASAVVCRKLDAVLERLDLGIDILEDAFPAPADEDAEPPASSLVSEPSEESLPPEPEPSAHAHAPQPEAPSVTPDEVIIPEPPAKPGKAGKAGK